MSPLAISVIIFLATVAMFLSGKISLGLIGITASIALELTGVLDTATVWGNFTNSSVVMFAALFVLCAGLMKTRLIDNFVHKLSQVQGNERKVLWACIAISIILSTFMNSTAAVAAMLPVILIICERSQVNAKKIIKPSTDMANMWTASLPVGMGASTYLQNNVMIEQMGGNVELGIFDLAIMKVPVLVCVTLVYLFFALKLTPNDQIKHPIDQQETTVSSDNLLPPVKETLTYIIFGGTVLLMLLSATFGWNISTALYPVVGCVLMVWLGILKPTEAAKKIPVEQVFLVGGMLNVAAGLGNTGGADIIGNFVSNLLGGTTNIYIVLAVLFIVPGICTQFMNNIAVANAFKPLAIATCMSIGIDPRLGLLGPEFAATASTMTPMASAPQAMIMGPGEYKFKDYLKCATLPLIVYVIVFLIWCPFCAGIIWPTT